MSHLVILFHWNLSYKKWQFRTLELGSWYLKFKQFIIYLSPNFDCFFFSRYFDHTRRKKRKKNVAVIVIRNDLRGFSLERSQRYWIRKTLEYNWLKVVIRCKESNGSSVEYSVLLLSIAFRGLENHSGMSWWN